MIQDEAQAQAWLLQLPRCDALAMERLERLVALLREENGRQNLVSRASLDEVWRRHIADSAQLLAYLPDGVKGPWLDLGTGAGFPGLVIAVLLPETPVWLVESRARRIEWLERARSGLGLDHAEVIGARVESMANRTASFISARAFAPLDKLLDLSARFSTADTVWLLPKGARAQQELSALGGWRHRFHVKQSLTEPGAGIIVGNLIGRKAGKT